jgi:hypothetical protein
MPHPTDPIPRSTKFRAPGTVPSAERLRQIRDILTTELHAATSDHGRRLEPCGTGPDLLLRGDGLTLGWVADFAESTLKRVIRRLPADLIGGAAVTRLDRALTHAHPRLPYRRALRIVSGRGWRLPLGDDLPPDAQASLVRFCGLLPVQVLFLPGQPGPRTMPASTQGLGYVLPWAGEALRCQIGGGDTATAAAAGTCLLRTDRILQFLLGLDAPADRARALDG